MKAVILAGGEGKRLRPYTITVAKPMVPIMNKPILEYSINLLHSYGIKDILITTCYKSDSIKEYFGDGSRFHVNISYLEERRPLGTAGGIFSAKHLLKEPFLVLSGDAFTNLPIDKVIDFHRRKKAAMTMVSKEVADPREYGVCQTNQNRGLIGFEEKPAHWQGNEVNTGVYIVEPFLLEKYARKGPMDFSQDLIPRLLDNHESVYVYKTNAYWRDIGNPEEYKKAREDLLRGQFAPERISGSFPMMDPSILAPFITRVQVSCPKVKKPFVMAKLLETVPATDEEEFMIEHRDGGWTRIVSDPDRGFIIYSKAERENLARELARYYGKKIKTWQKV
ncbi:NTP transferase domain-containing protein [Rossellomorea aquimaris]|uniref:nucleotidyltransferase family protein n=1 Tax=Rossellomorea aquimaris TaxID=189382 RepID=UPI001CD7B508|nr:nucleotidyltransferase family protein [Rossellomorea aquimaris]MCA1054832.1 NTP transferase domain-containing protein [Rossellomorea aquimaris]